MLDFSEYVSATTASDDTFLRDLRRCMAAASMPDISIPPEQANFMQLLLVLMGAREVVEIGTLGGYSAIVMARALPEEGRIHTIEHSDRHADFAADWIARSEVSGRIELHRGEALEVLATFSPTSVDVVFLDADKERIMDHFVGCDRILRRGGLILIDNAFAFGHILDPTELDPQVIAMRRFNEIFAAMTNFRSAIVPIGDGLWVGIKR